MLFVTARKWHWRGMLVSSYSVLGNNLKAGCKESGSIYGEGIQQILPRLS